MAKIEFGIVMGISKGSISLSFLYQILFLDTYEGNHWASSNIVTALVTVPLSADVYLYHGPFAFQYLKVGRYRQYHGGTGGGIGGLYVCGGCTERH